MYRNVTQDASVVYISWGEYSNNKLNLPENPAIKFLANLCGKIFGENHVKHFLQ